MVQKIPQEVGLAGSSSCTLTPEFRFDILTPPFVGSYFASSHISSWGHITTTITSVYNSKSGTLDWFIYPSSSIAVRQDGTWCHTETSGVTFLTYAVTCLRRYSRVDEVIQGIEVAMSVCRCACINTIYHSYTLEYHTTHSASHSTSFWEAERVVLATPDLGVMSWLMK
jgi:hypothetical protein